MKKASFLLFLLVALPVFSASVLKQAREALKKRQNLEQAASNLLAEAAKPTTSRKNKIECYQLAAECSQRINDAENMKLYLKQKYDTTKFFSTIYDLTQRVLLADSVGCTPDAKGRVAPVGRKRNRELLLRYRPNMLAGANWFYRRGQFSQAFTFFDTYVALAHTPILEADELEQTDSMLPLAAYLAVISAHGSANPAGVIRHASLAQKAGQRSEVVQELVVRAWDTRGDSAQWEAALWQGLRTYPRHPFFFTRLIDHLFVKGELDKGMAVADSMLAVDRREPLYWYAKSLIYMKQHNDSAVIAACDSCLACDSNYVDALYNKGIAALNLAVIQAESACTDLRRAECRRQQKAVKDCYRRALHPMERVRQLQPDSSGRWAPALYRIYLNLNMGKEFDEMDEILNGR